MILFTAIYSDCSESEVQKIYDTHSKNIFTVKMHV